MADQIENEEVNEAIVAEQQEWDKALEEIYGPDDTTNTTTESTTVKELEDEQEDDTETTTTTTETTEVETTTTTTIADNDTTTTTTVDQTKSDEDEEEPGESNFTARDARVAQREYEKNLDIVKTDVAEKIFADDPIVLKDADGDEIKDVSDVMKLVNPRTQEAFTEEEATTWFLNKRQELSTRQVERDREVERIAEVNLDLKDQMDSVLYRYGELFKTNPELRNDLEAEYQKTLTLDPKTGIIVNAPTNMEWFFDTTLKPYVDQARQQEQQEEQQTKEQKLQADKQRKQNLSDRGDIYRSNGPDNRSDDQKEWEAAEADWLKTR